MVASYRLGAIPRILKNLTACKLGARPCDTASGPLAAERRDPLTIHTTSLSLELMAQPLYFSFLLVGIEGDSPRKRVTPGCVLCAVCMLIASNPMLLFWGAPTDSDL